MSDELDGVSIRVQSGEQKMLCFYNNGEFMQKNPDYTGSRWLMGEKPSGELRLPTTPVTTRAHGHWWNLERQQAVGQELNPQLSEVPPKANRGRHAFFFPPISQLLTRTSHGQVTREPEVHDSQGSGLYNSEQTRGRLRKQPKGQWKGLAQVCGSLRVCYVAKCFLKSVYQCTISP